LVEVINRYLSEELTAFKLHDALSEIGAKTKDETVNQVVSLFWRHYDDVEDHKRAEVRISTLDKEVAKCRQIHSPGGYCVRNYRFNVIKQADSTLGKYRKRLHQSAPAPGGVCRERIIACVDSGRGWVHIHK
jgi:hypothetical protein